MLYLASSFIFAIFSFINKKSEVKLFLFITFVYLFSLAAFRFGLGTDYFNYYRIFMTLPNTVNELKSNLFIFIQIEPLFCLLMLLIKLIGFPFELLIVICSICSILPVYRCIQSFSKHKLFSVLIFFCNFYLITVFSMLRQGIAMSFFLYTFFVWLKTKDTKKFFIYIILATMFHYSALILLIIPLINKLPIKLFTNYLNLWLLISLSIILSIFFPKIVIEIFSKIIPRYEYYNKFEVNYLGIGLRLFELILVMNLSYKRKFDVIDKSAYKIFIFGILFFISISSISAISRLTEYFIFLEIILIPNLFLYHDIKKNNFFPILFLLLYFILFFKDLASFSKQVNFKTNTEFFNYPYITIFNKDRIKTVLQDKEINIFFKEK